MQGIEPSWLALSLVLVRRIATGADRGNLTRFGRLTGTAGEVRLPAQFQIVTESWNRGWPCPTSPTCPTGPPPPAGSCELPHHAEVLFSDDRALRELAQTRRDSASRSRPMTAEPGPE